MLLKTQTLPIFPSWLLGSSMRIKDFLNAISYSSYHVGRHADFLVLWMPCAGRTRFSVPLRGRRRVSGGAQESPLGRGGRERHWLARDTAWSSPTICAPSRTEPF